MGRADKRGLISFVNSTFLLFALLTSPAVAQVTSPGGAESGVDDKAAQNYILVYQTFEKCYECSLRTLMNCSKTEPDCNVPTKAVNHVEWFSTVEKAVERLNWEWCKTRSDGIVFCFHSSSWDSKKKIEIGEQGFVGLYKVQRIPASRVTISEDVTELKRVVVEKAKKKWEIKQ